MSNMSFRSWLSVVTAILLVAIVYFSRGEILHAWRLLEQVNIWILLLLIPGQAIVYYAAGEMIFSYLRSKGSIHHLNGMTLGRMALEMNFVNHILPSGGVSGLSYMNWRLKHVGIPLSRATMAQVVRFASGFAAFIVLLIISVIIVTIDTGINRWVITLSAMIAGLMTTAIAIGIFLLSSPQRLERFSQWLTTHVNRWTRKLTLGKKQSLLKQGVVNKFLDDLHQDYVALNKDKRILVKPFIWGLVFTAGDAALFLITFWALGVSVNPAVILIAYGLASLAAFFVVTPGGAGAYEAIMVSFLALAGVTGGVAIAGILLTRVILLLGTIIFGYIFYQHALMRYGKSEKPPIQR